MAEKLNREERLRRLHFRAWHRGTREADMMLGGFVDRYGAEFNEAETAWFEALLAREDDEIMAWMTGAASPPAAFDTPLMGRLKLLEHIPKPPR